MPLYRRSDALLAPSLAFILLCGLFVTLLIAGGASRADASGQVVVQGVTWGILVVAAMVGPRPELRRAGMAGLVLLGAILLAILQLVPLPPSVWEALPGRIAPVGVESSVVWRPISMVPGATWNALSSLVVPATVLLLASMLRKGERERALTVLLGLIAASTVIALLQFSGAGFANPFVNDTPGQVSGLFANRNHFALFLALGCLMAPVWATRTGAPRWRLPTAAGLVLLFILTILVTGSRAGMLVGIVAVLIALLLSRHALRKLTRKGPRWLLPALVTGALLVLAFFVTLFVAADRAVSINRAISIDGNEDMRVRGLPTVLESVHRYFPVGSGFGTFDPVFRMHEPLHLLKLTYFNHAHNDYLEIVLDGGVMAVLLLAIAVLWWGMASIRVWYRTKEGGMAQLGSAMLLLVLIASFFDYPVRTPMIMALVALAGLWLGERQPEGGAALPRPDQQL